MACEQNKFNLPLNGCPSCLQATCASATPQESPHTVPQALLLQTSTRPLLAVPPWSLMAPCRQTTVVPAHLTPASSACEQSWTPIALAGQSSSLLSDIVHRTSSSHIIPSPLVKPSVRATAPKVNFKQFVKKMAEHQKPIKDPFMEETIVKLLPCKGKFVGTDHQ